MFRVHRLVAWTFIENNENKICVNLMNSIRDDNRIENLEWVTYGENAKHGYLNGRIHPMLGVKGSLNKRSKTIIGIHSITGDVIVVNGINEANRMGFNRRNIWSVLNGKAKTHRGYRWEYA